MKRELFVILFSCISGIALAQTAQQVQLLQDRINADNVIIAQDQKDIQQDGKDYNSAVDYKQTEINNLNAEIQGAQAFLDEMSQALQQTNAIDTSTATNTNGVNW